MREARCEHAPPAWGDVVWWTIEREGEHVVKHARVQLPSSLYASKRKYTWDTK